VCKTILYNIFVTKYRHCKGQRELTVYTLFGACVQLRRSKKLNRMDTSLSAVY
jgi:hypothetical protein